MIELLEWIFTSGWRFLGVLILIGAVGNAIKGIITINDNSVNNHNVPR